MTEDTAIQQGATDRKYVRLVRLAYLVLPAGGRRKYRLAIAQRIVDTSLPGRRRGWAYTPARARVLRQAMHPSRRLRVGLSRRLRTLPQAPPAPPATLAGLDPAVRAAYVLRRVESLPRYMVRDHLVDIGVPDAMAVVEVAEAVPELSLPRVAPGPPFPRRSRLPVVAAGVITVAALVAAQTGPSAHQAPRHPDQHAAQHSAQKAARPATQPAWTATQPAQPAASAARVSTVGFWTGRLPGGGRGRWICTRRTSADGRTRVYATLIAGRRRQPTGDCGQVRGAMVSGTWWRAMNNRGTGGRWYFLAAAGPRFVARVTAPYPVSRTRDGLVIAPGPRTPRPPRVRISVTARRASVDRT